MDKTQVVSLFGFSPFDPENSMTFDATKWHSNVKKIFEDNADYCTWAASAPYKGRLIPLCTPVIKSPEFLVIGQNHADFDPKNSMVSEKIAESYSREVPKINTFLVHDHTYKKGLQRIARKSGLIIDEKWVGTNRCPIQTGSSMNDLKKQSWFNALIMRMDVLIKDLIDGIKPRYVITCGEFAARTFYQTEGTVTAMRPGVLSLGGPTIVPIMHPSRGIFDAFSVERLRTYIAKDSA